MRRDTRRNAERRFRFHAKATALAPTTCCHRRCGIKKVCGYILATSTFGTDCETALHSQIRPRRPPASQAEGRGFEARRPLSPPRIGSHESVVGGVRLRNGPPTAPTQGRCPAAACSTATLALRGFEALSQKRRDALSRDSEALGNLLHCQALRVEGARLRPAHVGSACVEFD
jgi:hypothetical protein